MREDSELLNEAAYQPTVELAVVLAERLEATSTEYEDKIEELKERVNDCNLDMNQLDDKIFMLQQEIAKNEDIIASMAAEIAKLKEQNNV
jgi:septal ring factor EnvC (AmiA/AmiB activator)